MVIEGGLSGAQEASCRVLTSLDEHGTIVLFGSDVSHRTSTAQELTPGKSSSRRQMSITVLDSLTAATTAPVRRVRLSSSIERKMCDAISHQVCIHDDSNPRKNLDLFALRSAFPSAFFVGFKTTFFSRRFFSNPEDHVKSTTAE